MTAFADRHIGPNDADLARMLSVIGYDTLDDLTQAVVPDVIAWTDSLSVPPALS